MAKRKNSRSKSSPSTRASSREEHPMVAFIRCANHMVNADKEFSNGGPEQKKYSQEKLEYFAFQALKESAKIIDMVRVGYEEMVDTNNRE